MTTPDMTVAQVWLVRCWSCGWQSTYAKVGYAKGGRTRHSRKCPGFRPPQQRSWWRP